MHRPGSVLVLDHHKKRPKTTTLVAEYRTDNTVEFRKLHTLFGKLRTTLEARPSGIRSTVK